MKKNLNENISRVQSLMSIINEESGPQIIQGSGGDTYQYKKEGEKYFYAKKSEGTSAKWIEAKGNSSDPKTPAGSIKSKIFSNPETPSASASSSQNQSASLSQNQSAAASAQNQSSASSQNASQTPSPTPSNAYPTKTNFSAIADDVYQDLINNKIPSVTIKSKTNQQLGSDQETLETIEFVLDINGKPFSATFSRNGLKLINQSTKKQVKPIWTDKKLKYRNFNATELDPDNEWMKTQIKLSLSEHLRILKKQFQELYLL